jgi:hypothetical protein
LLTVGDVANPAAIRAFPFRFKLVEHLSALIGINCRQPQISVGGRRAILIVPSWKTRRHRD